MNIKSTVYPEGYDISKLNTPIYHMTNVDFGNWYKYISRKASVIKTKKNNLSVKINRKLGFFKVELVK